MKKELLEKQKEKQLIINANLKKKDNTISVIRAITFLAFIGFIILGFTSKGNIQVISLIIATLILIFFIAIMIMHSKIHKIYIYNFAKSSFIDELIDRTDNNWKNIEDKGNEFLDKSKYFLYDLDIFGEASLFQYVNTSKTSYGRYYLSQALKNQNFNNINERKESINELGQDIEKYIDFNAAEKIFSYNNFNKLDDVNRTLELITKKHKIKLFYLILSTFFSFISILLLVLVVLQKIDLTIFVLSLIINFFLSSFINREIKEIARDVSNSGQVFESYDILIKQVQGQTYNTKLLINLKQQVDNLGYIALHKYQRIANIINSSNNIIFKLLTNSLFILDGFFCLLYIRWQKKYSNLFVPGIKALGEIESLYSLAILYYVKDTICNSKISNKLEFNNIKHPLIVEKDFIGNDFILEGINIITGSNMSGKTTFMRSIGINYILHSSGAPVCASIFNSPHYDIYTSMRANDNISDGISTFYAEIIRIKAIITGIKQNNKMLVLIDEIFKGTNSKDRIIGALKTLEKLSVDLVDCIVTTHDYELCEAANATNFHFEEYYKDNKIYFDYKIKKGKACSTNAIFLMKMAGIIE